MAVQRLPMMVHFLHSNSCETDNDTDIIDWSAFVDEQDEDSSRLQQNFISGMLSAAVVLCDILGFLSIILNLYIIGTIIRHRKRVLKNVFYVMVLHCAIVDLLRGCCLIVWGLPHVVISNRTAVHDRLLVLKINQFTIIILRSCNLLTIFNLLVFTCNEFIVIRYPLLYRRHSRRRVVFICLLLSWLISLTFGIGTVFSNFFHSAHSVFVVRSADEESARNGTFYSNSTQERRLTRRASVMSLNMLSMLMIFFLCYLSLFIVLICYGSIMCTIRRFRGQNLLEKGSLHSLHSKRIVKSGMQRTDSLQLLSDGMNSNKNWRHWKTHLMSRHKYLIVIGSVLFVDVLFLFPYSGIQLVALLHLSNVLVTDHRSALIRWCLQILVGTHAVCQPLCYFRMTEFRRLACSCKKKKLRNRYSHSTTQMADITKQSHDQDLLSITFHRKRPLMLTLLPSDNGGCRNRSVNLRTLINDVKIKNNDTNQRQANVVNLWEQTDEKFVRITLK